VIEPIFEKQFARHSYGFRPGRSCKDALRRVDELLKDGHRYADDFVILCRTRDQAETALERVRRWVSQAGLTLHPDKTRIADTASEDFSFLGFRFDSRGRRWPRDKSIQKLREAIRHKTRRTNGQSLDTIIRKINPTLRGWFGYFKHSYKTTFPSIDGWVRMRLRSILRKRQKKKGRGRGSDHQRWPNAFFAEMGLYSLTAAHRTACQSMTMAH
jgi:RNA-directed DNA polymerase